MRYIPIEKSLIPYEFSIVLADELFNLRIDYNNTGRFFTVELKKDGETICAGEPIIYGRKLFADVHRSNFPALEIIPRDAAGEYTEVTHNNFGETVFLAVSDGEVV